MASIFLLFNWSNIFPITIIQILILEIPVHFKVRGMKVITNKRFTKLALKKIIDFESVARSCTSGSYFHLRWFPCNQNVTSEFYLYTMYRQLSSWRQPKSTANFPVGVVHYTNWKVGATIINYGFKKRRNGIFCFAIHAKDFSKWRRRVPSAMAGEYPACARWGWRAVFWIWVFGDEDGLRFGWEHHISPKLKIWNRK